MHHGIVAFASLLAAALYPAASSGEQPAQTFRKLDCAALRKQSDSSWLVLQATTIVDAVDNTWALNAGQVIGSASIIISPNTPLSALIDKACAQ